MPSFVPTERDWEQLASMAERLSRELRSRVVIPREVGTIEDAVQEFMLWLHEHPNRVQHLMGLDENTQYIHFRTNFRWRMREIRGRTEQENLIGRVREMGKRGEICRVESGAGYYFSREPLQGEPRPLTPQEIRRVAHICHEIPQLLLNPDADRNSMVYSTPDLKTLINVVFDEFGGVSQDDLREIFKFLLTGRTPSNVSLVDEGRHQGMTDIAASTSLAVGEAVASICRRLSPSIQAVMYASMQSVRQEKTALLLGVTRQTVATHQKRAVDVLRPYFEEFDDSEMDRLSAALLYEFEASWIELATKKGEVE